MKKRSALVFASFFAAGIAATAFALSSPVRGDLTHNQRGDLITRATNGDLTLLSMNGYLVQTQKALPTWHGGSNTLVAVTDLDGNGVDDVVLEDRGVHHVIFIATNGTTTESDLLSGQTISPWRVVAGGDTDGDGFGDLTIQYGHDHIFAVVSMQGTNVAAMDYLFDGADISPWNVIGGGDLDGDGKSDLVIQADNQSIYGALYLSGTNILGAEYVVVDTMTNLSPWQVSAVSDLDGDGKSDLTFTSTHDGAKFALFMNGGQAVGGDYLGGSTTNQPAGTIVGPR